MILAELNKLLLNVARSSYLVNDAFIGDVYTINGKENKFGIYVATPMSAVKESGTIRYTYYMYYIDRLTKDEANIDFVQSDAVSMLKGLLDYIEGQGVEIETGYEFTLFRQKFSDWCAGAYVDVNILVADNDCQEGGFNAGGYSLIDLTVDQNGIYTPPSGYDGYGRIIVNVPQVGATEEWVDDEIDLKLTGYATQAWVREQHYLTQHQDISGKADIGYVDSAISSAINSLGLDSYATRAWVTGQDFLKDDDLDGYATQAWTNSQGFLKSPDLDGLATENWVGNQGFLTGEDLDGLATEQWVRNQNYLPGTALTGYATEAWVRAQHYATESELSDYATRDWINAQDFLVHDDLCGLATEQWVQNWVTAQDYLQECDLDGYATENWVLAQEYLSQDALEAALEPYATKTWVNNNFIDNTEIQDYATTEWVNNNFVDNTTIQNYATTQWVENNYVSIEDLEQDITDLGFATEQWVIDQGYLTASSTEFQNKLDRDDVWSGTEAEWNNLTADEQCSYLIALIVE